ncbi:hypothetical protein GmRootV59_62980 (plasmid) [Variovorax sp. V59]|uniref:hypothetical protein n=1 Tax=unclassified Variovorax TaxID=663243 RepID=UPI0034E8BFF0
MQHFFTLTLALALLAGCAASSTSSSSVPLPADIAITPPGPDVAQPHRAFSGKWSGKWRGLAGGQQQETVLVVESVTADGATVVYAQGDHSRFPAFHRRTTARIADGKLSFSFEQRSPITFTYQLQPDGTLKAESLSRGFTAVATLTRTNS